MHPVSADVSCTTQCLSEIVLLTGYKEQINIRTDRKIMDLEKINCMGHFDSLVHHLPPNGLSSYDPFNIYCL